MNNNVKLFVENISLVCEAVEEILNEWNSDNNMQFPILLAKLALKMNWDEKKSAEYDPMIRFYIKSSSDWIMNRGAHGGIGRAADKLKKLNDIKAKEDIRNTLKAQMKAAIEAKVLAAQTSKIESFEEENLFEDSEIQD